MAECKDCIHYNVCSPYTAPNESYPEVGGCKCFKNSADVDEVKHGEWIWCGEDRWNDTYECSVCGKMNIDDSNYCPNCGAKMDGKPKEEV